jgi:hypothetical protein
MFTPSRREVLRGASCGFGFLAFAGLAAERSIAEGSDNPLAPKKTHFPPKAKRVIFLCMQGGPSHVDTFDYKPMLEKHSGQSPGSVASGLNRQRGRKLMPSPFEFEPRGKSGIEISELYPNLAQSADDLCLVNSMVTDLPNHPQALVQLHTGEFQFVRPSMGAWVLYGLGAANQNLPGFITIKPPGRLGGAQNYGSAFLPAMYQGTAIGNGGGRGRGRGDAAAIPNIAGGHLPSEVQKKQIAMMQAMNRELKDQHPHDSQIDGVIESYELAFRMQSAVPKLMDLSGESQSTLNEYGIGERATDDFGRQCLLARRFAESGVRFIELNHGGWDQHNQLKARLTANAQATDKPMAALLADLKRRRLLEDTLVVWGGEFGRTPAVRNNDGRDHNATGFSFWMAGGGVRGGMRYGTTDDFGIAAATDKMHVHDLHATILHLLGLDHTKLTYRYAGRDFRLTGVAGRVAQGLIA